MIKGRTNQRSTSGKSNEKSTYFAKVSSNNDFCMLVQLNPAISKSKGKIKKNNFNNNENFNTN